MAPGWISRPIKIMREGIRDMEKEMQKNLENKIEKRDEVEENIEREQDSEESESKNENKNENENENKNKNENKNENVKGTSNNLSGKEAEKAVETPKIPEENWQDILGNCDLMKKIIKQGQEWTKPLRGDVCTLNIKGRIEGTLTRVDKHKKLEIILGDGDVVQGLDLVIVLMDIGEVAEVIVEARFAYGSIGEKNIPGGSNIRYFVELVAAKSFDLSKFNFVQRQQLAEKKRLRGNWWYDRKELYSALECYKRVLVLTSMEELPKEEITKANRKEMLKIAIMGYNNMAVTQMRLGLLEAALENLNYVLKHDPKNVKALHRKAKLLADKGESVAAHNVFLQLQNVVPHMKIVQAEVSALEDVIVANAKKEKSLYRRMLGIKGNTNSINVLGKKEDKNGINKKVVWSIVGGASAVIFSMLVHKFVL